MPPWRWRGFLLHVGIAVSDHENVIAVFAAVESQVVGALGAIDPVVILFGNLVYSDLWPATLSASVWAVILTDKLVFLPTLWADLGDCSLLPEIALLAGAGNLG